VFGEPLPEISVLSDAIELRPFSADDIALIEDASSDPFIPTITTVPAEYSPEAGMAFIERQATRPALGEGWSLAIVDRTEDLAIGQVGLWIPQIHHGRAEIGYWVAPSARGRGGAAAATRMLSDWAFESIDVDRIALYIEPWNEASRATARRAGFTEEALLRHWQRVDGEPKDMWSYTRLRTEWAAQ